ncbi:MAG: hypothetical protein JWQ57_3544 [Mucilaginibacter sp.]|nr:hypothetical protein [Mucilaginibacter sp.]
MKKVIRNLNQYGMPKAYIIVCAILYFAVFQSSFKAIAQQTDSTQTDTTIVLSSDNRIIKTDVASIVIVPATDDVPEQQLLWQGFRFAANRSFTFTVKTGSANNVQMSEGSKVYFSFTDGSVVNGSNTNTSPSKFDNITYGNLITGNYLISRDIELALINKLVTTIKIEYDEGVFSFDLNAAQATALQQAYRLIK